MSIIWKIDFCREIWISSNKLDSVMEELGLTYDVYPRDKKVKVVNNEAQKAIKNYLWIK